MININCLASSSSGNCYVIDDGQTKIMVECGLPWKQIQIKMNFKTSEISAMLCSHSHSDHSRSAKDLIKNGISCHMHQDTANELGVSGYSVKIVEPKKVFAIGTWQVMAFELVHDVTNLGYLLQNEAGEKLVYITDSAYCHYTFTGITHLMLECNYSMDILNDNVAKGIIPFEMKKRLIKTHMGLETVKGFLMANDLSQVHEIHLLHLSDGNSDEARFKREIQKLTGKMVMIAQA
jgi:phosphoribosyl 1,2-cyclic phosphodiesterase